MRRRLLWKLLLIAVVPVIGVTILVVWLAIDHLASAYLMTLMTKYNVSPTDTHQMFLTAIHHYLIWATLAALILALMIGYLLAGMLLRPLSEMTIVTREVAAGNFSARVATSSRDEVGELAAAFNRMADSLEQVERLRKSMVADVAHELRTPLTNLRGFMEALSDGVIPPETGTFRMLEQEIIRLVHLVEDLQQLARADAARAFLERRELSLHEVIEQILGLYRHHFREKRISVVTSFAAETDKVKADRDKLLQAVRNLVDNAWKYTPEGGNVSVVAARDPERIMVTFTNSGEGIGEKDLPYLFERFYRADRSRSREVGGAGLGLAIVRELIEAHGGTVGADSSPGENRVWFTLPT